MVLFYNSNDCVAKDVVTRVEIAEMLIGTMLHPSEVGVQVTTVHKPSAPIVEPFMYTLGESLQCTIEWSQHRVQGIERHARHSSNSHRCI